MFTFAFLTPDRETSNALWKNYQKSLIIPPPAQSKTVEGHQKGTKRLLGEENFLIRKSKSIINFAIIKLMNQKGFANIALIILAVVLAGVAGYFALNNRSATPTPTPPVTNGTPTNWQFIDANSFTLSLPPSWEFNKLQGIDSYVGEFVGDGAKLGFDYGWYSNSLAEDNDPNHTVTYETISGYRAKIVVPKVAGSGTTGVYFGDLGNQNRFNLYGDNLTASQQESALKIFRTLKFKK